MYLNFKKNFAWKPTFGSKGVDPENLQHFEIRLAGKFCEDKSQESSRNLTFNNDLIHNSSF